jgi:hypothetical protein
MHIDAFDDVVAVEKRSPREAQQVRQSGVGKYLVHRLGVLDFVEEGAEAANAAGFETARELPSRVVLAKGPRVVGRRDPIDEGGSEDRPLELVVGGLVDQDLVLTGEEPGQRAGRERIATVAQQVGGGAADDEVELELGMAMGAGSYVAHRVPHHASIQAGRNSEVAHRKKR